MAGDETIKKEIIALAGDLPKTGRTTYGSKEMEPYRERVDRIVQMLLAANGKARQADKRFYEALSMRQKEIENICGKPFLFSNKNVMPSEMENDFPKYHNQIDITKIHIIEDIKADYKRRQGNLVLNLCKIIKPELWGKAKKVNDNSYKKHLGISRRSISSFVGKFFKSFGDTSELYEREFSERLREIEREIEKERKKNASDSGSGETK